MYRNLIITSIITSTLIFSGCVMSPQPNGGVDSNSTEGGKGTQLLSMLSGALLGAGAVYLRNSLKAHDSDETEEEREAREERESKQMLAGFVAGGAVGYVVGGKLADMQKRYKGEENKLIARIIDIDNESEELKEKNHNLMSEVDNLDNKITRLETNRVIKGENRAQLKQNLIAQLQTKKAKLKKLIKKNQQLSQKISSSKSQVNQYEYKAQDKKDILTHVNKLSSNSKKYEKELYAKIALIDERIRNLA